MTTPLEYFGDEAGEQAAGAPAVEGTNAAPSLVTTRADGEILGRVVPVSVDANGVLGNATASVPVFSPDGTKLAFTSSASNLVAGTASGSDVFIGDLVTGDVTLVSKSASGANGNGESVGTTFSPDGTKVAFSSIASNLVQGVTASFGIYVKDLATGATALASTNANGAPNDMFCFSAAFSPDGTKLAFLSYASNLVAGDTNGVADIFVKDLATGAVTRASTGSNGFQADGASWNFSFSPDCTRIAFSSSAANLVAGDTNGVADVFVKDLVTGAVTRVSTDANGAEAHGGSWAHSFSPDGGSWAASFSPDGTRIAFVSSADNLVAGDTNGVDDIFVKDLVTGAVTRVSTDASGLQADGGSSDLSLSPDGTKVAFVSSADNLVAGDTNGVSDVFVKDLATGAVTRVSTLSTGGQADGYCYTPVFSPDGTAIAFLSSSGNMVPGQSNAANNVFVKLLDDEPARLTGSVTAAPVGKASGWFYFGDPDAEDTHTVTVVPRDGAIGTLAANVSYDTDAGSVGQVTWSYTLTDAETVGLQAGRQQLQTFDIVLDDGHGGLLTETVTITATGADHAPTIVASAPSAVLVTAAEGRPGVDTSTVVLTTGDVDPDDTAHFDTAGWTAIDATHLAKAGTFGTATLDTATATLTYALDGSDPDTLALGSGAVVTDTFSVAVRDDAGAAAATDVTFTIESPNAAPMLAATATGERSVGEVFSVSATTFGFPVYNDTGCGAPAFSPDGTRIAFYSRASLTNSNPFLDPTTDDIFVRDLATGAVSCVSTTSTGDTGTYHGDSTFPVFSPDGTKVVFLSTGILAANDASHGDWRTSDVYMKDLTTGATTCLSNGGGYSFDAVFSPDGTKVAFRSAASLVAGDTNQTYDIFVRDLETGTIERVSTSSTGQQGSGIGVVTNPLRFPLSGGFSGPVFAPDGTKIAFSSQSPNILPGDSNGSVIDVLIKDLVTGALTCVSTNAAGVQANGECQGATFSPDGTKIAFWSAASNLVAGDTNGVADIFVKDLLTGAVSRVSTDKVGAQGNGACSDPVFSPDGSSIAFVSSASNLVAGDTNGVSDIFVKDLVTGAVTCVSTTEAGALGDAASSEPVFSPDGTRIAYSSKASNLSPDAAGGLTDVFVKDLAATSVVSATVADSATVTRSGRFFFTDPDASDTHTVSVVPRAGTIGTLTAVIATESGTGQTGQVAWSYSLPHAGIATLPAGVELTQVFDVTVDDGRGGLLTQAVTLLVITANDGPTVVASAPTADLVEAGPEVAGVATSVVALTKADLDEGDAATFDTGGWTALDATHFVKAGIYGAAMLDVAAGTLTYTLDDADPDTQMLANGDRRTEAFGITVHDEAGANATTTATFTILGTSDMVAATDGDDVLQGEGYGATINGGAGNDRIVGTAGADRLEGGAGDDILFGHLGNDVLDGGDGRDAAAFFGNFAQYQFGYDWQQPSVRVSSSLTGEGADTLTNIEVLGFADGDCRLAVGGMGSEEFFTAEGRDVVFGGYGDDQIWGTGDGDLIDGGAGTDTVAYAGRTEGKTIDLSGRPGSDTLLGIENAYGTGHGDTIIGSDAGNVLAGLEGSDTISGAGGGDMLFGGAGDDSLSGGEGTDGVFGGAGNDTLSGGAGHDFLNGGEGTDTVVMTGALSDYTFFVGPEGKTTLVDNRSWAAGAGAVDGVSTVVGDGIDTVQDVEVLRLADGDVGLRTSTAASEVLTGGAGADLFVFAAGFGKDTITNFAAGTDDIVFAKDVFGSYDLVAAAASQVDADVVITLDADTTLTLANVQLSALGADDFRFV